MMVGRREALHDGRLYCDLCHAGKTYYASQAEPFRTFPSTLSQRPQPSFSTRMGELLGKLFVIFVTLLICFIGYSSQIFVIWPWYGSALSVELISLLVPFK